eukprot:1161022-Pelagomonas_calceolata.AAC.10
MSNPGNYRMIVIRGVMHRINANVLKNLVNDWHLQHAAKSLEPQQSPRPHAVLKEFSQAYDTMPRLQLWDHLQRIAMPTKENEKEKREVTTSQSLRALRKGPLTSGLARASPRVPQNLTSYS